MAQTRGVYELVDDNEADSGSPITESLIFRLRDQWYGALCVHSPTGVPTAERIALPERAKTVETDQGKFLRPDGSGGVEWASVGLAFVEARGNDSDTDDGVYIPPTEITDTGGDYDAASGEFTAPVDGVVRITVINLEAEATDGGTLNIHLQKDTGSGFSNVSKVLDTASTGTTGSVSYYSYGVSVNSGDKLRIFVDTSVGGGNWSVTAKDSTIGSDLPSVQYEYVG